MKPEALLRFQQFSAVVAGRKRGQYGRVLVRADVQLDVEAVKRIHGALTRNGFDLGKFTFNARDKNPATNHSLAAAQALRATIGATQ